MPMCQTLLDQQVFLTKALTLIGTLDWKWTCINLIQRWCKKWKQTLTMKFFKQSWTAHPTCLRFSWPLFLPLKAITINSKAEIEFSQIFTIKTAISWLLTHLETRLTSVLSNWAAPAWLPSSAFKWIFWLKTMSFLATSQHPLFSPLFLCRETPLSHKKMLMLFSV